MQFDGGHLLGGLGGMIACAHAQLSLVERIEAGGKAETLSDDQRFRTLLGDRVADAAHEPRDPHPAVGGPL